ncbi:MAG: LysR family transcriptional regulator [Myxococcales bacterium]|nr:LysR family transcriptional regulator [Myxococcales bacterium]
MSSDEGSLARVRELAQFWNWLPAFRAVAESEHLPTAAQEMATSASGLSRTVKQLEDALERALFDRDARRIALNEEGRVLLEHVRDAMRRVHDGLQAMRESTFRGELRVSASNSVAATYVLPAIELLAAEHPELQPQIYTVPDDQVPLALRKGALDLALVEQAELPDDLEVTWLESSSYSVYAAESHALSQREMVTLDECLAFPFVAPPPAIPDGWPRNLRRRVMLRVNALSLGVRACARGGYLAVLPDDYAIDAGHALRRLPLAPLSEQPIFMAHRKLLASRDRVSALRDALVRTVERLDQTRPERFISPDGSQPEATAPTSDD